MEAKLKRTRLMSCPICLWLLRALRVLCIANNQIRPTREEFPGAFLHFTQSSDSCTFARFASFAAYFPHLKQLSSVPFVKPWCPLWLAFGCGSATLRLIPECN